MINGCGGDKLDAANAVFRAGPNAAVGCIEDLANAPLLLPEGLAVRDEPIAIVAGEAFAGAKPKKATGIAVDAMNGVRGEAVGSTYRPESAGARPKGWLSDRKRETR